MTVIVMKLCHIVDITDNAVVLVFFGWCTSDWANTFFFLKYNKLFVIACNLGPETADLLWWHLCCRPSNKLELWERLKILSRFLESDLFFAIQKVESVTYNKNKAVCLLKWWFFFCNFDSRMHEQIYAKQNMINKKLVFQRKTARYFLFKRKGVSKWKEFNEPSTHNGSYQRQNFQTVDCTGTDRHLYFKSHQQMATLTLQIFTLFYALYILLFLASFCCNMVLNILNIVF